MNNINKLFSLAIIFSLISFSCIGAQTEPQKRTKSKIVIADMDDDLKDYPEYYKKRVMAFRKMIRTQTTKKSKINKAIAIMNNAKSPYRKDALQFLTEIKAQDAVPSIIKAGEKKDLRADSAYALGEIKDKKAIEFLIRCLYDSNHNVRGNASLSLRKITRRQFGYSYSDVEEQRNKAALLWENWWTRNQEKFQVTQLTEEEKTDAAEKWEKYGKKYIERILSE